MNLTRSLLLLILGAAVVPQAGAHFKLLEPASWIEEDRLGDPQKAGPCGGVTATATAPANPEPGKERTYVPIEGISADVHLYSDGKFPSPDFALANLNLNYHTPPGANPTGTANNLAIARIDIDRGWQKAPPDDAENAPDDPTASVNDRDADDTTKLTVAVTVRNYRAVVADKLKVRLDLLDGDGELRKSYSRTLRLNSKAEQAVRGKITSLPSGTSGR